MGLDITAYRNLRPDPDAKVDEDGGPWDDAHWNTNGLVDYTEKIFPGRANGITEGVYQHDEDATFDFRAGSYSGYSQ